MLDINLDEHITSDKKITINSKIIQLENNIYSTIKCYKSLPDIENLEAKSLNIIKIHKTIYLNLSNLTTIDMRENRLCKISKNFKLFKNLETLHLDNNQISYVPSFISEFTQLKTFTISNNILTSIPASIQYLTALQTFKFSNNKVDKLPIEFGQLKSLECLYLDNNYFSEIPTTLCYLRYLNEISFEWFEFLEPPFLKVLKKDDLGKTCINIIRDGLQEMIKNSILYCDFITFIENISSNEKKNMSLINSDKRAEINNDNNKNNNSLNPIKKNSKSHYKYYKIIKAIENNYYGIVRSLLNTSDFEEYIKIKNEENKTAFYLTIQYKNEELISLFLSKIELTNFPVTHIYLHKAIRMRNPELVKKLISMGVNINATDDQGSSAFHILFDTFVKQFSRCALIGDFLLQKDCSVNPFNNDNWAPIHIAARKASKQCLLWIISSNKKLRSENKEEFNLNLKGHNNWTPLHLTINFFRLDETIILLENGCEPFIRNNNAKTPKKVCIGNYVFSKLLSNYENIVLGKKYKIDEEKMFVKCYTTVDDEEEIFKFNKDKKINLNILKKNTDSKINKVLKFNTRNFDLKNESQTDNNFINEYDFKIKGSSISDKYFNLNNSKSTKNNFSVKLSQINNNEKKYFNQPISFEREIEISENHFKEPENLNYLKDLLLNNDLSAYEKYEALKNLKLSKQDIELTMKNLINNLDLDNNINISIISEICNFALSNVMTYLIPLLKQIEGNTQLKGNKSYIKSEINNTISILEKLKTNYILIKFQSTLIKKEKFKESNRKKNIDIIDYENEMFFNPQIETEEIEINQNENFNFDELIKINKK